MLGDTVLKNPRTVKQKKISSNHAGKKFPSAICTWYKEPTRVPVKPRRKIREGEKIKERLQGKVLTQGADLVQMTANNPRGKDVSEIIKIGGGGLALEVRQPLRKLGSSS